MHILLPILKKYISNGNLAITIFLFVSLLILLFVALIVIKSFKSNIKKKSMKKNHIREFKIDFIANSVMYVDISKSKYKNYLSVTDFYNQFNVNDRIEVKNWLKDLCDKKKTSPFIAKFVTNKTEKSDVLVLFRPIKVNSQDKIIHLESYIYPNIKKNIAMKGGKSNLMDENAILNYIDNYKKKAKKSANLISVSLFENDSYVGDKSLLNRFYTLLALLDKIFPKLKKSNFFFFHDYATLCFVCFENKSNENIVNDDIVSITSTFLDRLIKANNNSNTIDYRLSINQSVHSDFKENIIKTIDYAKYAIDSLSEEKVVFVTNKINFEDTNLFVQQEEVKKIIENKDIKTLYAPFVDIETGKNKGFITSISFNNEIISDSDSLYHLAYSLSLQKELLTILFDNILSTLNDSNIRKKKRTIFIPLPLQYIEFIVQNIDLSKFVETSIVILINYNDILKEKDLNEIKLLLDILKQKNASIGIYCENTNLDLPSSILECTSFIVFAPYLFNRIKKRMASQISLSGLTASINKKNIEYLAEGVDTIAYTELLQSIGVNYISGSSIGESKENLEEVSKLTTQKISDFFE